MTRRSAAVRALFALSWTAALVLMVAGCGDTRTSARAETAHGSSTAGPVASTPFAADSFWNTPLPADPAPNPDRSRVDELVAQVERFGAWINSDRWSIPVYEVAADTPRVPVRHDNPHNPELKRILAAGVPIPVYAEPAQGDDGHMVIWDRSADEMWEFWTMRRDGEGWIAGHAGYIADVSRSDGIFPSGPNWGATATGLAAAGGLIRLDEWSADSIDHALAIALPETMTGHWVWPAQRSDGFSDHSRIPQGARFRLDPALDLDALDLPAASRAIARAAQRYGIVVRDHGGAVTFYAEAPTNAAQRAQLDGITGGISPERLLANFPWRSLQAVELGPLQTWPTGDSGSGSGTASR